MASPDNSSPQAAPAVDLIYIGSGFEALIEIQLDAWEKGRQAAIQAAQPLEAIAEIARAAEKACDEALLCYVPLDEARFCETYTLAWSTGYCAHTRGEGHEVRQDGRFPLSDLAT